MTLLTPRQKQVLDLFLAGNDYKEVAAQCGISTGTVNPHLRAIAKKLGSDGIARDKLRVALDRPTPAPSAGPSEPTPESGTAALSTS